MTKGIELVLLNQHKEMVDDFQIQEKIVYGGQEYLVLCNSENVVSFQYVESSDEGLMEIKDIKDQEIFEAVQKIYLTLKQ